MVLLDVQEFSDLSLDHIWGAIVTALNRARSSLSAVCTREDVVKVSHGDLRNTLHGLKNYRPILIFDNCNCSSLLERSLCYHLLILSKRSYPTLIVVPNPLYGARPCALETGDQFVPIDLALSPEPAQQFVVDALSETGMGTVPANELSHEIVDWVGGNLALLDCACHWTIKLSENPRKAVDLWLSTEGDLNRFWLSPKEGEWGPQRRRLGEVAASEERPGGDVWLAHPTFRRIVYEMCLLDAQQLFARWLGILDERGHMILLAIDELQRLTPRWQSEIEGLSSVGFVQGQGGRYLIRPKMFSDYMRQPTVHSAGPFRLDLKTLQTVYVRDTPCELSPGQACVFFRLFLHRNHVVPYGDLYADLHAPYVSVAEDRVYKLDQSSVAAVDRELDQLRKILKMSEEIERVPFDGDAPSTGYRLAVSPEDQDS
jgi:hypothetical protein